jgi:hypothetical protein
MTHPWKEKLEAKGLKVVELSAQLRRVRPLASTDFGEVGRWLKDQKAVLSAYPETHVKRKAELSPEFIRLYLRIHPEIELNEQEMQFLFEREEFDVPRAEELEMTQRIALALEDDPIKRMEGYEAVASLIVLLRRLFSGGLRKQLGTKKKLRRFELLWAIAQNMEWVTNMLRGNVKEPPGRVNVELANLTDAILEHQKEPLTQVELYEALKAAGAKVPENPEAFRTWLHRARKAGLVKNFRSTDAKSTEEPTA